MSSYAHVVHTTAKQGTSRRRKNENVFKMSKDEKCTCKACKNAVFHCQICKFAAGFLCHSRGRLNSLYYTPATNHKSNPHTPFPPKNDVWLDLFQTVPKSRKKSRGFGLVCRILVSVSTLRNVKKKKKFKTMVHAFTKGLKNFCWSCPIPTFLLTCFMIINTQRFSGPWLIKAVVSVVSPDCLECRLCASFEICLLAEQRSFSSSKQRLW